jgi:histidinol-phosphate aminotransferase
MRRLWRDVLDRVAPYDAGKSLEMLARELGVDAVLRLSANENPLGPSPRVVEAIRREAPRAHLYPDGGGTEVRQALGKRLGTPPSASCSATAPTSSWPCWRARRSIRATRS